MWFAIIFYDFAFSCLFLLFLISASFARNLCIFIFVVNACNDAFGHWAKASPFATTLSFHPSIHLQREILVQAISDRWICGATVRIQCTICCFEGTWHRQVHKCGPKSVDRHQFNSFNRLSTDETNLYDHNQLFLLSFQTVQHANLPKNADYGCRCATRVDAYYLLAFEQFK